MNTAQAEHSSTRSAPTCGPKPSAPVTIKRKELVTRLLAGRCEACGRVDEVEVHHVAKLADLGRSGNRPPWADLMAARHGKTLVVCGSCHPDIHGTRPVPALTE
ncbi:HNH endonuclease [Streptomyces mirabilis]|uniref:HNH endonuclease n=1 Tax=Streptomyces mirabilis TaxID=68239 RepID=UPI0036F4105E